MTASDFPQGDAGARMASDLAASVHTPKVIVVSAAGSPPAAPAGSTQNRGASGNVANAAAVATLDSDAAKTTYIAGFSLTAAGATTALPVIATVAGLLGGTMSFIFVFPAGVRIGAQPYTVAFDPPLPASAADTDIVVTLPAGGAGNTHASANAWGYKV